MFSDTLLSTPSWLSSRILLHLELKFSQFFRMSEVFLLFSTWIKMNLHLLSPWPSEIQLLNQGLKTFLLPRTKTLPFTTKLRIPLSHEYHPSLSFIMRDSTDFSIIEFNTTTISWWISCCSENSIHHTTCGASVLFSFRETLLWSSHFFSGLQIWHT